MISASPTLTTDLPASHPRRSTESRIFGWLTQVPSHGRTRSLAIVLSMVLGIGWTDYASGIWFSLQLFYLIPIVLSVAWLGWRAGCAVAIICVLVRTGGDVAAGIFAHVEPFAFFWNRVVDLGVCGLVVWSFNALLTLQRRLEQRVAERTADLREAAKARSELEKELVLLSARERNEFGQELHDDICQHLVGTALAAKVLASRLAERDHVAADDAQAIVDWIEEGADRARRLARGLLLSDIAPTELAERLKHFVREAGPLVRFTQQGYNLPPDSSTAAQFFRIAQEATRNALRHANPKRVEISLVGDERALCLMVEDDGRGLPPEGQRGQGIGLRIMARRAAYVGGTLSVVTSPTGTRVICRLPHTLSPA